MSSLELAGITFACIFGGALLGMFVRTVLPENHLSPDSKDVVKVGMGLIATMAALVLGLLTGSAKSSYDTQDGELKQMAANVLLLDRTLAHYGPDTKNIRDQIRRAIEYKLAATWPEDGSAARVDTSETTPAVEGIDGGIRALSPQSDVQRGLQSRALEITGNVLQTRWLLFGQQAGNAIQTPLLVVLVFWLAALFASFGLFAPRNATVIAVLCVSALSVAGAILAHPRDEPALPGAGEGVQRSAALHPRASRPVTGVASFSREPALTPRPERRRSAVVDWRRR